MQNLNVVSIRIYIRLLPFFLFAFHPAEHRYRLLHVRDIRGTNLVKHLSIVHIIRENFQPFDNTVGKDRGLVIELENLVPLLL